MKPEEGYMKSAKSLASLGGSLLQGVVVSDRMSLVFFTSSFQIFSDEFVCLSKPLEIHICHDVYNINRY